MTGPAGVLAAVSELLEKGGGVMLVILLVTLLMWTLILERFWYFRRVHPEEARAVKERWRQLPEHASWYAKRTREQWISEEWMRLRSTIPLIRTLVTLCPMLGLLGTVAGMMEVFDAVAISGRGNVRATASGVSKATLTTMAGLVAALSGFYFGSSLERTARRETERLASGMADR